MRISRTGTLAMAAVAGVTATIMAPTAALADYYGGETNYAVATSGPAGSYVCAKPSTGVTVCFRAEGDIFYVKDTKADGYSAVAAWHMLGYETRTGSCVNKLGADHWGLCNKDLAEDRDLDLTAARYDAGSFVDWGYNIMTTT